MVPHILISRTSALHLPSYLAFMTQFPKTLLIHLLFGSCATGMLFLAKPWVISVSWYSLCCGFICVGTHRSYSCSENILGSQGSSLLCILRTYFMIHSHIPAPVLTWFPFFFQTCDSLEHNFSSLVPALPHSTAWPGRCGWVGMVVVVVSENPLWDFQSFVSTSNHGGNMLIILFIE